MDAMSHFPLSAAPESAQYDIDIELYEHSPDCIKILNIDGTIRRLNPGGKIALELDSQNQLDGADWPSLWPGSERERVQRAIADARAGKRTQFLAMSPTAKKTPRWWDVIVTPIPGGTPSSQGLLAVSRDVTELVYAREALAQANERKNEFLAILSHELRNPLSTLGMAAQMVEQFGSDPVQMRRLSATIARQVAHMSRLAEDLLDVSRISRGEINLKIEAFDVRHAVRDAGEQLASTLLAKAQTLHLGIPEHAVLVAGDRTRLTQVLGNLIGNASRYSPAGLPVEVSLAVLDKDVEMTVSDQGQGIPPELMPTLFDMYSQGQVTTDRKVAGVGLGLAIVNGLMAMHGGSIRAYSEGAGKGSRFVVSLPRQIACEERIVG